MAAYNDNVKVYPIEVKNSNTPMVSQTSSSIEANSNTMISPTSSTVSMKTPTSGLVFGNETGNSRFNNNMAASFNNNMADVQKTNPYAKH